MTFLFGYLELKGQSSVQFNWKEIGPDNMGGRVRSLVIRKDGRLYAGAALGGLWTSNNDGKNWSPVTTFNKPQNDNDNVCLAVSSIAIDPNNEDIMIIGTGELAFKYPQELLGINNMNDYARGWLGFSGLPGQGVFVSTDGGKTFSNNNATWADKNYPITDYKADNPWISVQKVAVSGNTAFAATLYGLYVTNDLFKTVVKPAETYRDIPADTIPSAKRLGNATVFDIEVSGDNVYVTTADYLFISRDKGQTFSEAYGGVRLYRDPFANQADINPTLKGRMEVAVAPSDPNIVYLVETSGKGFITGTWISRDAGKNWEYTLIPVNELVARNFNVSLSQGVTSLSLQVHSTNPEMIFLGSGRMAIFRREKGWQIPGYPLETYPWNPMYIPQGVNTITPHPTDRNLYYLGTNREIIRMRITPPYSGVKDTTIRFEPATGNFNASGVISVAINGFGTIVASTENAGVVLKDAKTETGSFRIIQEPSRANDGTGSPMGLITASALDTSHFLTSAGGLKIKRTLDAGNSYEPLNTSAKAADTCFKDYTITEDITRVQTYGTTPFVLKETINPKNPYVSYNFVRFDRYNDQIRKAMLSGRDSFNIEMKQYVYAASRSNVFRVTNPFNTSGRVVGKQRERDTILVPMWNILNERTNLFERGEASPTGVISCVAVAPNDKKQTVYVGTVDGRLFRITSANNGCIRSGENYVVNPEFSITQIIAPGMATANENDVFGERWLTSITVKPDQPDTVIVTFGGYDEPGTNNNSSMVYATFNASAPKPDFHSLHSITTLPYMPIYSAMFNPKDPNGWLALGTENGIYVTDPKTINADARDNMIYKSANDGDMTRVPVYGFAYQEYGFGREVLTFTLRITDGSGGVRNINIEPNNIADFYSDVKYRSIETHNNIFSNNLTEEEYRTNLEKIKNAMERLIPTNGDKVNMMCGVLVKKASPPVSEEIETLNLSGLTAKILKTKEIILPMSAEKSVGKLLIATYGKGVMTSDIVLENAKTTNRPNEDRFAKYDNRLMQIYPNPTQDNTNISLKVQRDQSQLTFEVYATDGRKVMEQSFENVNSGRQSFELETAQLPSGIYMVKGTVQHAGQLQTQTLKLTINK
jgi:hypothetical protein